MSHPFITTLIEAAGVKFLGTVAASSLKKPIPDENDDPEISASSDAQVIDLTNDGSEKSDKPEAPIDGEDEPSDEFDPDLDADLADAETSPDEADPSLDADSQPTDDPQEQDQDRMGDIRTIKGAHLVYKRQQSDGSFNELWIYNIGGHINDAIATKRAILAGTDIADGKMRSEDGKQIYSLTTMGNAQLLSIEGLSN